MVIHSAFVLSGERSYWWLSSVVSVLYQLYCIGRHHGQHKHRSHPCSSNCGYHLIPLK